MSFEFKGDRAAGCLSEYELDAFWLAGCPADHPLGRHLESCADCRARLRDHEQARQVFEKDIFPASVDAVADRLAGDSHASRLGWLLSPRLAAVAAFGIVIVLLAVVLWQTPGAPGVDSYSGIKGSVGLQVFCLRAGRVFQMNEGERLLPADHIRFRVSTAGPGFVLVVALDADGGLQTYAAVRVAGGEQELPGSIVMDESRADERIFAFFAQRTIDFEQVRAAVSKSFEHGAVIENLSRLPVDLDQTSLLFRRGDKR